MKTDMTDQGVSSIVSILVTVETIGQVDVRQAEQTGKQADRAGTGRQKTHIVTRTKERDKTDRDRLRD